MGNGLCTMLIPRSSHPWKIAETTLALDANNTVQIEHTLRAKESLSEDKTCAKVFTTFPVAVVLSNNLHLAASERYIGEDSDSNDKRMGGRAGGRWARTQTRAAIDSIGNSSRPEMCCSFVR